MPVSHLRGTRELPAEVSSFVGRGADLDLLTRTLREGRLVTLVGPGGVGKSRIALHAAHALRREFANGASLVELSTVRDPELLPGAVADLLGLPEQTGQTRLDTLVGYLRDQQQLLILDTCEHLLDAAAMLAEVLLREAPLVTVLATSRQPLDVPGEHTLALAPLDLDDAVDLFAQRAASVVPGFTVGDASLDDVRTLCTRLDGIPLAIELATVRLRALPLGQLLKRLEARFRVLGGGRRSAALPRHQTLRTTIAWSHDLCTTRERLLWARLSVFAGAFDVGAAEAVCSDLALPEDEVVEHLIGLVDKSIVLRVDEPDGATYYRLLDTIREFGAEQLDAEAGSGRAVRARHAAHQFRLVEAFHDRLLSAEQVPLLRELHRTLPDLRSAFAFAFSPLGEPGPGVTAAADLWPFWVCSGLLTEGRMWIDRGLAAQDSATGADGSFEPEVARGRAWGLIWSGVLATYQAEIDRSLVMFAEARELAAACGAKAEIEYAFAVGYEGGMHLLLGNPEAGRPKIEFAKSEAVRLNHRLGLIIVNYQTAYVHAVLGNHDEARELTEAALRDLTPSTGECILTGQIQLVRAFLDWQSDRKEDAVREVRTALDTDRAVGEIVGIAHGVEMLAWEAAEKARWTRAAWLLGAADVMWGRVGAPMIGAPPFLAERERIVELTRERLGPEAFERLARQGGRLEPDYVIELALANADRPVLPSPRTPDPAEDDMLGLLTRREREVADLVSEGLTNREIAERLVISKRTADAHVEHILGKFGFASRAEIAALLREQP